MIFEERTGTNCTIGEYYKKRRSGARRSRMPLTLDAKNWLMDPFYLIQNRSVSGATFGCTIVVKVTLSQ